MASIAMHNSDCSVLSTCTNNGLQNPYLLLEYSSVTRAIEQLFVGRWPEGPASWPQESGYGSVGPPQRTLHMTAVREHLD